MKLAKTAFVGWNGELANGGNYGDFWDSGLVTTERDATDSELGVAVGLFDGGTVRAALGAADAARRQSPPPRARSRSGLVETRGNARATFSFDRPHGAVVLEALPLGEGATVG